MGMIWMLEKHRVMISVLAAVMTAFCAYQWGQHYVDVQLENSAEYKELEKRWNEKNYAWKMRLKAKGGHKLTPREREAARSYDAAFDKFWTQSGGLARRYKDQRKNMKFGLTIALPGVLFIVVFALCFWLIGRFTGYRPRS